MKAAEEHLLIFEGASAGQHVAAGAAWVDLPEANPSGRAERERAIQYPQRSRPSEQRDKNRQMVSALRVAEIQAKGHKAFGFVAWHGGLLRWLRGYSPLRGCAREAALPAAHSFRNGLYAILSALPKHCRQKTKPFVNSPFPAHV
jgi:hypothetical protein